MCFRKDPDDRPSAAELLSCSFLEDTGDIHDVVAQYRIDDTDRIRRAIDCAVSNSRSSANFVSGGETIETIDQKLKLNEKNVRASNPVKIPDAEVQRIASANNPFVRQPAARMTKDEKISHPQGIFNYLDVIGSIMNLFV